MSALGRLLIVDDEEHLMSSLRDSLDKQGYEAIGFTSGKQAQEALNDQTFDLLLTDLMMPDMDGIELLREAIENDPSLIGIVMTGQGTIQTAVEAIKIGAFDYILKPFKLKSILPVIARALEVRRLKLENLQLQETVAIYELTQAITFTLDIKTILNKLADAAMQQCMADEVSILLPSSDGEDFYIAAVRGARRDDILGLRVPRDYGIAGWVAQCHEPLLLQGEVTDPRLRPALPRPEIRSAISMPLLSGGKLVGELNVNAIHRRRPFSLGEVKSLSILASTGATALESARLYTSVREAEEKYRSIFENAFEGIFRIAPDGRFIAANPALACILGYDSPEEMMTTDINNHQQLIADPENRSEFDSATNGRNVRRFERQLRKKDGSKIWVSGAVRSVCNKKQELSYYEGSIEDITEGKRAEEKFRGLLESAPDAIVIVDKNGNVHLVNSQTGKLFGYSSNEILGKPVHLLIPGCFTDSGAMGACLNLSGLRKNGSEFPAEISLGPIETEEGTLNTMVIRDVSERVHIEEQLRQSQKLEAIGQLAGGVAHDFNNLLTAIIGYSQIALRGLHEDDPMYKEILEIEKAGTRAATLTRQLLAFSHKQVLQPKVLSLNEVISEIKNMLQRLIGEDVELAVYMNPELGLVKADPGQVEQVIMNLALNARDAMPKGGKLTIETQNVYLDESYSSHHVDTTPGQYIMLAISDTGIGMDKQTQSRIFEPFFTTKERGKGTGLGLSTVFGIVKQSGGHIGVYSELDKGTTLKVYLPQVQEPVKTEEASRHQMEAPGGSETILLVEDEEVVRKVACRVLRRAGYTVLDAANAGEAFLICEQYKDDIDLIITDIVMPRMSGSELAQRLGSLHSEMKILYISGYTDGAIVHHGITKADAPFLQKPFTPDALARKVREVLNTSRKDERD